MTPGSRRYPDLPSRSALLALAAVRGRIPSWRGVCIVYTLPWRDPLGSRPSVHLEAFLVGGPPSQ